MIYEVRFPNGNKYEVESDVLICKGLAFAIGGAAAAWAGSFVAGSGAVGGITKVLATAGVSMTVGSMVEDASTVAIVRSMVASRNMANKILESMGANVKTETVDTEG